MREEKGAQGRQHRAEHADTSGTFPCLFCSITQGKTPAHIIGEDAHHLAFLTPFPNTIRASVVITKAHHDSDVLAASEPVYLELMLLPV